MTHLDLFSGIGGFHLAAEWAGFETIGFAEIEPYCCKLLAQKWPEIPNYGDIRTADFSGLQGRVTVLSAGIPCQKSSAVGSRIGPDELWETACDIIELVEPAWVILENPSNILTFLSLKKILLRLESLSYEVRGFDIPAESVGADFLGYRVFIIAASQSKQMGIPRQSRQKRAQWDAESEPCRVANGVSDRSHRLKALGNAVVPQQAYPFFEAIVQTEIELRIQEKKCPDKK